MLGFFSRHRFHLAFLSMLVGWMGFWVGVMRLFELPWEFMLLPSGVLFIGLAGFRWSWMVMGHGLAVLSSDEPQDE